MGNGLALQWDVSVRGAMGRTAGLWGFHLLSHDGEGGVSSLLLTV